ncbi:hypothetical protein CKO51_11785 [Rhodopirellula sp. SM50]|nr:hypothetical protein [Rhodopirellula sp. SM50]PAY19290.1 hypothetical protein CKO51_11785 [Rhodopirellula sp. SM50]
MGITVHYRGTIDDLREVETLEDRILDLALSLGGRAAIWRSFADHDCQRVVRGVTVEMAPGHETLSLLVSPEGHLTPLHQIKDAEKAAFDEPPDCFVKTQFGSLQGHVAIVHLLDAIRQRFCSNLEVSDEGEYYETRDVNLLHQKMQFLGNAINAVADGLQTHGLNQEAAEDPSILTTRIERIATLVQQKLLAERLEPSGSVSDPEDESGDNWREASLEEEVQTMDRLRRQNDMRSERMMRRIAEATASDLSADEAFELAMKEEGFSLPNRMANDDNEPRVEESLCEQPWLESLPPHPFDEDSRQTGPDDHPAVLEAESFLLAVMELAKTECTKSSFISVLVRASMDMVGGIAQATSGDLSDITHRALAITQLKRALTGHAYARGAIFGLRSDETISGEQSTQFLDQLDTLLTTIHRLAENAWI